MIILYAVILGIVQGLTEFLPVSSSAHLALLENLFGMKEKVEITVFLHFGSALALIVMMWQEIKLILLKERKTILLLIVGSIPAGIAGVLFGKEIEALFNSPRLIGVFLIITGIILWFTIKVPAEGSTSGKNREINFLNAFLIGIAQSISAVCRGISRSGSTISSAMYLGINRVKAVKFSFLLGIISILGSGLFESAKVFKTHQEIPLFPVIVGVVVSFIISCFAIKFLLNIVKTKKFAYFAFYCWALGLVAIFFSR